MLLNTFCHLPGVGGPVLAGPLFQHVNPGAPMLVGSLIALLNVKIALALRSRLPRHQERV